MLENGIFVSVVNSLRMKRFCSQSIRKVKTDRIDAMQIALYGLAYWQELQPTRLPEDTYRELQLLARQYYQMTSLLIKAKVDFNAICDQVLPGMQELMNDHAGRHKLRTLSCAIITPLTSSKWENALSEGLLQMGGKRDTLITNVWRHIFATAQNGIPVLPNAHRCKLSPRLCRNILSCAKCPASGTRWLQPDCGDRRCPTLSQQAGSHRIRRHRCAAVPVRQILRE